MDRISRAVGSEGRPAPRRHRAGQSPWSSLAILSGLVWALALGLLALPGHAGLSAPSVMAATAGAALLGAVFALLSARSRRHAIEMLSADLTAVSDGLVRLSSREAERPGAAGADVAELARVAGHLGDALAEHERRIEALAALVLKRQAAEPPPPPPVGVPARLETRDDFARATSFILQKLGSEDAAAIGRALPPSSAASAAAGVSRVSASPRPTETGRPVAAGTIDRTAGQALDALGAGRVELHLQPIVVLPQRKPRLYTAIPALLGPDGTALPRGAALEALDSLGQRPAFDGAGLARSLAAARYLTGRGSDAAVTVPISHESLRNGAFLADAERQITGDRDGARRLVLALRAADLRHLGPAETAAVSRFTALGVGLMLDGVGDLATDWGALVRRGFDYASIDCGLILESRLPGETGRLVALAAAAGLRLIATEVDREELVPDLLDYDVPLARGAVIGGPRPVRAEILADPGSAAMPAIPPGERTGFRDFLRRAG